MSPMTRARQTFGTEAPNDLVALYYAQRAAPGSLVVTECIYTSPEGRGYVRCVPACARMHVRVRACICVHMCVFACEGEKGMG